MSCFHRRLRGLRVRGVGARAVVVGAGGVGVVIRVLRQWRSVLVRPATLQAHVGEDGVLQSSSWATLSPQDGLLLVYKVVYYGV